MLRIPNHGVVHGIGTPPWTSGSRVIGLVLYTSLGTEVGLVCLFIMQSGGHGSLLGAAQPTTRVQDPTPRTNHVKSRRAC